MARPSKYETHVVPRLLEVEDWVRNGATDEEIAKRLGISRDSFYLYKREFSDFSDTLKKSKDYVDGQVENALLQRALGYDFKEVTKELRDGELVPTKIVTKHMAPDTAAQIFWLKNRRPEKWREKPTPIGDEQQTKEAEYDANSLRTALSERKIKGLEDDEV